VAGVEDTVSNTTTYSAEGARTVRRWRKIFTGAYLAFTVAAAGWALLSLLAVHCGYYVPSEPQGPRIGVAADDPAELRRCHRSLERLLVDLHDTTFSLQARALKYDIDPATEWRNWSRAWTQRWRQVNHRCRLSEPGDGPRPILERMRPVHAALAELQLGYSGVVDRFIERYADRLRQLRSELRTIRALIDRQRKRRSGGRPPMPAASAGEEPQRPPPASSGGPPPPRGT